MKRSLETNIWKYAIFLITNKRTYMTILGVYLLTLPGTTPKTLGLMNLLGNVTGFIFEVPSGYIADKMGHKNALVFARLCYVVSTALFLIGSQVWVFILGAVFLNLALAFQSGTSTAFMHETLKALGRDQEYSKIMGRLSSIGFAVPIALIVAIPFLVSVSFKVPFMVALVIDVVGLLTALSFVVPERTKEQIKEIDVYNFGKVLQDGWRYGFFKYAFFGAIMGGAITGAAYYKDVYQAFLGVPIIYFGIFWAASRVLVSGFLLTNEKVKDVLSFHHFLFIKMIVAILLIVSLGIFSAPWVIVGTFILISAFNWSFKETQQHYILEIIGQSNFKATLLSLKALISTLVTGVIAYFVGLLAAKNNYSQAFMTLAVITGVLLIGIYIYILWGAKRKQHNPAQSD